MKNPWAQFNRWYARKYVCPFWGHKSDDGIVWYETPSQVGRLKILGRASDRCENCGEVIPPSAEAR